MEEYSLSLLSISLHILSPSALSVISLSSRSVSVCSLPALSQRPSSPRFPSPLSVYTGISADPHLTPWPFSCLCVLFARSVSAAKLSVYSLSSLCIHRHHPRPADLAPWPSKCLCVLSARSVLAAKLSVYSLSSLCIHRHLCRPVDLAPCCYHLSLLIKPLGEQKLSPIQAQAPFNSFQFGLAYEGELMKHVEGFFPLCSKKFSQEVVLKN